MKSRLEKVYNKLPNQKVNLKAQKIDLSLVNDIDTSLVALERYYGEFEDEYLIAKNKIEEAETILSNIVTNFERDVESTFEEIEIVIEKIEELGLDRSIIGPKENQLERIVEDMQSVIQISKQDFRI
tara:strand:- start:115 stop:495 length:381 start_codon:yes stop_codon:yes gene_type:complete